MDIRKSPIGCLVSLLVLVCALAPRCAAAAELLVADAANADAKISEFLPDARVVFVVNGNRRETAWRDLIRFGAFRSIQAPQTIVLSGGDLLAPSKVTISDAEIRWRRANSSEQTIPRKSVRGIVLRAPTNERERDQLLDDLAKEPSKDAQDRVILDNGDAATGNLVALSDAKLVLRSPSGDVEAARERIRAIALDSSVAEKTKSTRLVVGLADGTRVTAVAVKSAAEKVELTTVHGFSLTFPREEIVALQTLGGRATYLSDLKPASYKHIPYLSTAWPLAVDRSTFGTRLRTKEAEMLKGIGMHSAASAAYVLDRSYRWFEAELAIDRAAGRDGSVVFRIYVDAETDGGTGWKLVHTSQTIRGGDKPIPVSIDIAKAKRLSLIVDYADRADEQDHADWLNARLIE